MFCVAVADRFEGGGAEEAGGIRILQIQAARSQKKPQEIRSPQNKGIIRSSEQKQGN